MGLFLNVPGVPGEATVQGHANEIELLSFHWLMGRNPVSVSSTGTLTSGKFSFDGLQVTKYHDLASAPLFLACASGAPVATAVLSFTRVGQAGQPFDLVRYSLKDVRVVSLEQSGTGADPAPVESVTFNFGQLLVEYFNPNGTLRNKAGWNVIKNVPV